LHTEMEGGKLLPAFDAMLSGWKTQGYRLGTVRDIYSDLALAQIPTHALERGTVPGRSGTLMVQGARINA
jgi:undecaprenyl phosphate-alpha-L-ara4FN deformylase